MWTRTALVALILALAFLTQACATGLTGPIPAPQRIIAYPPQGKLAEDVSRDKAQCDEWAKQETGYANPAAEGVKEGVKWGAIGAAAGAAIGVAVGAVAGDPGFGAGLGAVMGGASGGLSQGLNQANAAQYRYENAYALCMGGRGYQVTR